MFSIIIVTFNAEKIIKDTLESCLKQTYRDIEVIVKDGGSKDGTLAYVREKAKEDKRVRVFEEADKGIYDAMNQAVNYAEGDFIIFMNAGDRFYDETVLERVEKTNPKKTNTIIYGDAYFEVNRAVYKAAPRITGSVCYRNIPCHQAIIYSIDTLKERPFDTNLKIRADFEHFNDAYWNKKREFQYLDFPVCYYEGGGFSENKKNRKRDKEEYKISVRRNIPLGKRFIYRATLIITLYKLRGAIARNPKMSEKYQRVKALFYKK